ncbi:hypothetical protein C8R45DRAFT_526000 [Mycena sanguinolenta]|nr:hypothetical protein C8R45DRAFT_526000 [Mycena sanguinolenta]
MESLSFIPYAGLVIVIQAIPAMHANGQATKAVIAIASIPLSALVVAMVLAVITSRGSLSAQVRMMNLNNKSDRFWAYWQLFGERYPLLHFCGVFLIPMIYWVMISEIRSLNTADDIFSPSFGQVRSALLSSFVHPTYLQVLAVFVVLDPLQSVLKMVPRASRWFNDLAIIRVITRRRREFVPIPVNLEDPDPEMVSLKSLEKESE